MASPKACVAPVTTAILPDRRLAPVLMMLPHLPFAAQILLARALPESGCNSSLRARWKEPFFRRGTIVVIGLGVIGAGRIGRIHAGNVAAHAGAKLVAVSDAVSAAAESLAAELGTKATSREAILADKSIAGVLICSPTDTMRISSRKR